LGLIDCGLVVDFEMEPARDELTDDDEVRMGRDVDEDCVVCCGEVELAMRTDPAMICSRIQDLEE